MGNKENSFFEGLGRLANGIGNATQKIKCFCGKHQCDDFHNITGQSLCYKEGKCIYCKEIIKKIEHEFGEYFSQEQCIEIRECIHCRGARQIRTTHKYTKSRIDEKCRVIGICEICGNERPMKEKHHQWEIITEEGVDSEGKRVAKEKRKCLRCGE